jgi:hypothetical protein
VFVVDGLPTSDGRPLSFTAEGTMSSDCIGDPPCKALPEFSFIKSPAETLVAQRLTGPYTATFENVALVFSNALAIGSFALTAPDGTPQNARIVSGEVQFQNGEAINAWLRGKTSTAEDSSPMPVLMVIANRDFLETEVCRIYDIVGPQVPVRLEAHTMITRFTIDPTQ